MSARRRGWIGHRLAATSIEFALVMPVLLTFLLGELEYGRMIWVLQAMHVAGEETARCVAIGSSACASPSSYAVNIASSHGVVGLTTSDVAIANIPPAVTNASACNPPGSNVFVQVTLTLPFSSVVAKLIPSLNQSLVTVACYPVTGD